MGTSQCFATVLLAALATACGGGESQGSRGEEGPEGPAGPAGLAGPAGSEDSPEDVLEKLAEVGGEGSGLDADQLDGLSSEDFTLRGPRSLPLPILAGHWINSESSGLNTAFPGDGLAEWQFQLLMPADIAEDSDLALRLAFVAQGAAGCSAVFGTSRAEFLQIETGGEDTQVAIEWPEVAQQGLTFDSDRRTVQVPIAVTETWQRSSNTVFVIRLVREGGDALDTCDSLNFRGASLEYTPR